MSIAELVQQCLTLSLTKPANAAAGRDLELFHQGRRADPADTGQRLQQRGNLQLGNGFIVFGVGQNLLQGGTSPLEGSSPDRVGLAVSLRGVRGVGQLGS